MTGRYSHWPDGDAVLGITSLGRFLTAPVAGEERSAVAMGSDLESAEFGRLPGDGFGFTFEVRGPVEIWAFSRLASAWAGVAIALSLLRFTFDRRLLRRSV